MNQHLNDRASRHLTDAASRHLSDDDLRDWLLEAPSVRVATHMAECAECRDDALRLRGALGDFRESLRAATEGRRWQQAVQPAAATGWRLFAGASSFGWASAVAAVLLVAAGLWLLKSLNPSRSVVPQPQAPPVVATDDARDDALLAEVHEALDRAAPQALSPAEQLGPELNVQQISSSPSNGRMKARSGAQKKKGE